ncbi:hypothetical protein AK830_g10614 [Neonectria ditissima]|uniref:Uncharacterized protein n=1 Tax=Neonectria ditissima TaxID=78410 RepID=A0A0N8H5E7_9HYPO|nr:hypothetical protein AK830_g10614 [Neonectria ditissima]
MPVTFQSLSPVESSASLLANCLAMEEEDPEEILPYLRASWHRISPRTEQARSQMEELKEIRVPCEKGLKWRLSKSYLPTRKLRFLSRRYMLEEEEFPFIELEEPLKGGEGVGTWDFLQSGFGVKANDDLDFYVDILYFIRRQYSNVFKGLEFPRRILELYLRIHAACSSSGDFPGAQHKVRALFEEHELVLTDSSWIKPSMCLQKSSIHLASKVVVLPPPQAWEATDAECVDLTNFYQDTLGIPGTCSWVDVLTHLEEHQSQGTFKSNMAAFYNALDEMVPHLSDQDANELRSSFDNKPCIGLAAGFVITWYMSHDCVWAPGLNVPGKLDVSEHYPKLESFFAGFLKIPQYSGGVAYKELINLDPKQIPVDTVKDMIWSLNAVLPEYGHLLDPGRFLKRSFLPIREPNGQVSLCSAETEYFIPNEEFFQQQFFNLVRLLDFTPHQIWLLEPLISWANLENRFLSWHTRVATYLSDATPEPTANVLAPRAHGILRIARHFRSPRVRTAGEREAVLKKLQQSQFFQTDGIYLRLTLSTNDSNISVDDIETDLHIEESDGQLSIYMPHGEESQELCLISKLPRRLVGWMMTDSASEETTGVDEIAVGLVKSILKVRDTLVPAVLDAEGVGKAEDLDLKNRTKSVVLDVFYCSVLTIL